MISSPESVHPLVDMMLVKSLGYGATHTSRTCDEPQVDAIVEFTEQLLPHRPPAALDVLEVPALELPPVATEALEPPTLLAPPVEVHGHWCRH